MVALFRSLLKKHRSQRTERRQSDFSPSRTKLSPPFAHLNLRCNPFGAPPPADRAELAVIPFEMGDFIERLQQPGHVVQFTGKKGRGKSTHLRALHACFPDYPYTYVPQDGPIPAVPDTPVHFIDEMQRVPRRYRRRIFNRRASFVIGSHKDHRREIDRAGLTFEHFELKGLTVEKIMAIIQRRISWACRDPESPLPSVSKATAARLVAIYGDNIRAIEDHLYDRFQEMEKPIEL